MEKMPAQSGSKVGTQTLLHLKMDGTLAGAMEEVQVEPLGVGVSSPGENGESQTVMKPKEGGMLPLLHPRTNSPVPGVER